MQLKERTHQAYKDLHNNKEIIFVASTGKDFHSRQVILASLYD